MHLSSSANLCTRRRHLPLSLLINLTTYKPPKMTIELAASRCGSACGEICVFAFRRHFAQSRRLFTSSTSAHLYPTTPQPVIPLFVCLGSQVRSARLFPPCFRFPFLGDFEVSASLGFHAFFFILPFRLFHVFFLCSPLRSDLLILIAPSSFLASFSFRAYAVTNGAQYTWHALP